MFFVQLHEILHTILLCLQRPLYATFVLISALIFCVQFSNYVQRYTRYCTVYIGEFLCNFYHVSNFLFYFTTFHNYLAITFNTVHNITWFTEAIFKTIFYHDFSFEFFVQFSNYAEHYHDITLCTQVTFYAISHVCNLLLVYYTGESYAIFITFPIFYFIFILQSCTIRQLHAILYTILRGLRRPF